MLSFCCESCGKVLWWAGLSVCLSDRISLEPHAWSLPIFQSMLPMAVAWSSSDSVMKSQGEGAVLGFSSPLTMHCNTFTANNIMQQQNGLFHRCGRGMMGLHIAGEVWSTIALLVVGMVVEDCLLLLLNLLKHNVSNQNYLKEGSYIQRLPSCMDIEYTDQPGGDMWSAQKVTNVHLMLEVCSHLIFLLNSHCIPTSNYYHFFSCFKIVSLCPLCQGKQFLPSASLVVREFSWDSPHWASYSLANCSSVSQ